MAKNKVAIIVSVLVILVLILGTLVVYAFVLKPMVNGYTIKAQNYGVEYALLTVAQLSANCQIIPITIGNRTIQIIDTSCLQQPIVEG